MGTNMVACPHCGTQNSTKREYCYQCEGAMRGAPKKEQAGYVPTCGSCSQAAIYAPAGIRLSASQVWCMKREQALASDMVAGDCFTEAFGWRREETLD